MIPYRIKHKATGLYYKPGRPLIKKLEDLGYETRWIFGNQICFKVPKSDFEIEYLTDSKGES